MYYVSDGKLQPKAFTNIDLAVQYADEIKGLVLTPAPGTKLGFNIVYSWGERKAFGLI
jgi:hypothetical protein